MAKSSRARYTLEFKLEAVRMVKGGQSLAAVSKVLGIADQTLHNWIKSEREGRLGGADSGPVSPEQMELSSDFSVVGNAKVLRGTPSRLARSSNGEPCRPSANILRSCPLHTKSSNIVLM